LYIFTAITWQIDARCKILQSRFHLQISRFSRIFDLPEALNRAFTTSNGSTKSQLNAT